MRVVYEGRLVVYVGRLCGSSLMATYLLAVVCSPCAVVCSPHQIAHTRALRRAGGGFRAGGSGRVWGSGRAGGWLRLGYVGLFGLGWVMLGYSG